MQVDSQAVDNGASLSTLPLPVVDLSQKAKEGFLGVGHVAVWGPAQELEVTHHELALLELWSCGEAGRREKSLICSQNDPSYRDGSFDGCAPHNTNAFRRPPG